MIKPVSVHKGTGAPVPLQYQTVKECPICHVSLEPTILHEIVTTDESGKEAMLSVLSLCSRCRGTFLSTYAVIKDEAIFRDKRAFNIEHIQSVPLTPVSESFPENIQNVSPRFVDIYNQAYQAEQLKLSDICGMGYRKALEFLIKDYLLFKNPDDSDVIEKKPLSQCVDDLVQLNPAMKAVAKAAVWLGNDETHFVRKYMNYDTQDLKQLIHATVTMIELQFSIDAAEIIIAQR